MPIFQVLPCKEDQKQGTPVRDRAEERQEGGTWLTSADTTIRSAFTLAIQFRAQYFNKDITTKMKASKAAKLVQPRMNKHGSS